MDSSAPLSKRFLFLSLVWLVISYLVLWALGGGCTNAVNGSNCVMQGSFSWLKGVPVVGLFLPFDSWQSLMFFFAPLCGFIFSFIFIKWWNNNFNTDEAAKILFPILLVALLIVGYAINLSFYVGEAATLNTNSQVKYSLHYCIFESDAAVCNSTVASINQELVSQAQARGASTVEQQIPVPFWPELRRSIYLLFILGAIAAWVPFFARRHLHDTILHG